MDDKELPEQFLIKMKELLGESYEDYLNSFQTEDFHGLRVNTLKCGPKEFAAFAPWNLKPVGWISNGFYYDGTDKPSRHPFYYAGLYYLQEPSAMTPASLLPIEPGDRVLDLCAAPGGKSTELAAKLRGTGMLFSNDVSNSRAKALLKNLELTGAENFCVSSETPEKLAEYFEGFFDKILVDAPCSGEGMFRRDSGMVKSWSEKGPDYYSAIQKTILEEAVKMLKPGGMLLYSTCTFDRSEDEESIRFVLERHPDMRLVPLKKEAGFAPGIGMPECVRLFPHLINGEGHFIALLSKNAAGVGTAERETSFYNLKKEDAEVLEGFFTEWVPGFLHRFDKKRLYEKNGYVYLLPEPFLTAGKDLLLKIRYLRTGLLLGEIKKGRFEPSQALAMCLKPEECSDTVQFSMEDERAVRYLKGETVSLKETEENGKKGWCLVCLGRFPLGFAKRAGASLKNKYFPGWRWQ